MHNILGLSLTYCLCLTTQIHTGVRWKIENGHQSKAVGRRGYHCLNSAVANICPLLQLAGAVSTSLAAFCCKSLIVSDEMQLVAGALLKGLFHLLDFQVSPLL